MEGVSFVVPVHNGAACLREALESILAQTDGRPMEVVVVDDCSTDGSSELLRRLAEIWPLQIVAGEGRGAMDPPGRVATRRSSPVTRSRRRTAKMTP